jgi:hypothetical protein
VGERRLQENRGKCYNPLRAPVLQPVIPELPERNFLSKGDGDNNHGVLMETSKMLRRKAVGPRICDVVWPAAPSTALQSGKGVELSYRLGLVGAIMSTVTTVESRPTCKRAMNIRNAEMRTGSTYENEQRINILLPVSNRMAVVIPDCPRPYLPTLLNFPRTVIIHKLFPNLDLESAFRATRRKRAADFV